MSENAHRQAMQAVIDFLQKKYKKSSDAGREALRLGDHDEKERQWNLAHEFGGLLGALQGYLALADRYALIGRGLPPEHQRQPDDIFIIFEMELAHMRDEIGRLNVRLAGGPQ